MQHNPFNHSSPAFSRSLLLVTVALALHCGKFSRRAVAQNESPAATAATAAAAAAAAATSTTETAPVVPSPEALAALAEPAISRLAAVSPTAFKLQWRLVTDGAPPPPGSLPDGFRIYRDGAPLATVGASVRCYLDSGLKPATVYRYTVAALFGSREIASRPQGDITRLAGSTNRETVAYFDVVVAGATPGGIAAALTAARLGDSVALVSPSPWLGGMRTGGLSRTDFGSLGSAGGLFLEFTQRVLSYYTATYGADSSQVKACRNGYYFEPHVAKWVFTAMLAEQPGITVMLDHSTRDVMKNGNRVTAVYVLDRPRMMRKTLVAPVFIDATYDGDLAAQAGAAYRIGREGRADFNEEHAGEIFWDPVKSSITMGSGEGDRKVQAYNYRLTLTTKADNAHITGAPPGYDRSRYLTLLPDIASGRLKNLQQVLSILPLPGDKFDANNHPRGNPSSDLIGGSDSYPEADHDERSAIATAHRRYLLGLLYFVQHDAAVPAAFAADARRFALADDEYLDNGRFPTQLYIREGRRIIGRYTFTENDARSFSPLRRPKIQPDSVAVADYPIDSHATSPEKDGLLEGFFYLPGSKTQASQIPYGVMTPLGIEGVLVSVCVSCTHIGYGTLRMEPVFMALGSAAGAAAHLARIEGRVPSQVDIHQLQRLLLDRHQVISVFDDVPQDHPCWQALQYFGAAGFFSGYQTLPDQTITRAEAAIWLWQWMQQRDPRLQPNLGDAESFADVTADDPAYLAVHSLAHAKVLAALPNFAPAAALSESDAAAWIANVLSPVAKRTALSTYGGPGPNLGAPGAPGPPDTLEAPLTRGQFCDGLYWASGHLPQLKSDAAQALLDHFDTADAAAS
jgi:hypothetical protein